MKYLIYALFIFNFSCFLIKNQNRQKFQVKSDMKKNVQDSLKASSSEVIISLAYKAGLYRNYHGLLSNTKGVIYKDTTDVIYKISDSFFAYSFFNKKDSSITLVINSMFLGTPNRILRVNISKNEFSSLLYTNNAYNQESQDYLTENEGLILEKPSYHLGDTIVGCINYQGLETVYKKRRWKEVFYFKCVISDKDNLFDITREYPIVKGYSSTARR